MLLKNNITIFEALNMKLQQVILLLLTCNAVKATHTLDDGIVSEFSGARVTNDSYVASTKSELGDAR